jgi:predicted membrane channel-forming protein YqfA (hemolysin III family)
LLSTALFLAGVAALSALLVLPVPDYEGITGGELRHEGSLLLVAILVLLVSGPLALVGVAVTWAYLSRPRPLTRRAYYVVLFLILVANVVLVATGGWRYALTECRPCEGPVFWPKTVLLASLFIVIAPLAKGVIFRPPAK